jgi:hypothetical protein
MSAFDDWRGSVSMTPQEITFCKEAWRAALRRAAEKWIADNGFDKHGVAQWIEREIAGG